MCLQMGFFSLWLGWQPEIANIQGALKENDFGAN